jgi:hypothetical protein
MSDSDIPFVSSGTYLFRFMNPRSPYFWSSIIDLLSQQQFTLNSRTNFNDPYDSQPIIVRDLSNSAIRNYIRDALQHPFNPTRSAFSTARLLQMKASGRTHFTRENIDSIKLGLHEGAKEYLDKAGLLSFSLTAQNPLLWGHYAASFTGVCAIFRRGTSADSALSLAAKVAYVGNRPRLPLSLMQELARRCRGNVDFDEIARKILFLSFLHKSDHWAYEQEARIFHPFHAYKKLPFDPREFVGFILGPVSSDELEKKIRSEIAAHKRSASLDKSTLSQTDFRIIIPHKFTQQGATAA